MKKIIIATAVLVSLASCSNYHDYCLETIKGKYYHYHVHPGHTYTTSWDLGQHKVGDTVKINNDYGTETWVVGEVR